MERALLPRTWCRFCWWRALAALEAWREAGLAVFCGRRSANSCVAKMTPFVAVQSTMGSAHAGGPTMLMPVTRIAALPSCLLPVVDRPAPPTDEPESESLARAAASSGS